MADVALAGIESASGSAQVHAISRHGLLPAPQSPFEAAHGEADGRTLLRAASVSIRSLLRAARALAADIQQRQGDWREAIACMRALAPALWQRLPQRERRRFLRHLRCYWDVHRHRLPPRSSAALQRLRHSGELVVHAGRILRFTSEGQRIRVTWRGRGEHRSQTLLVDRVVNCTGPDYDLRRTGQPLLRSLLAQGLACPDPLGVGLVTEEFGTLTGADGRGTANLHYLGPLLRATHWESTAVAELREHAAQLAQRLLQAQCAARAPVVPPRAAPCSFTCEPGVRLAHRRARAARPGPATAGAAARRACRPRAVTLRVRDRAQITFTFIAAGAGDMLGPGCSSKRRGSP